MNLPLICDLDIDYQSLKESFTIVMMLKDTARDIACLICCLTDDGRSKREKNNNG